jgi:Tol biopolymer transport system component/tRNA A-37 threonylcarbamoyl transferase component Bud32
MPVSPGTRLGAYEIIAALGAGGMGEVYRARDPRLGRDVAIKICAEQFSDRFEREARAVAALNHPNICQIYDVSDNYLVMELVAGETLKGPLPVELALNYAKQICEAIEAAHEKGIVHRDLKPANIKVTLDGTVKVLDFGLAKAGEEPAAGNDPSVSPTLTLSATRAGMIVGTAAYMSPEQARGKAVDKRADIWAFGAVLYEMLTGKPAFHGETTGDILAAVIKEEPSLDALPPHLRPIVERCLRKDPRKRWRDIGDVRIALEEDIPSLGTAAGQRSWIGWTLAAVLGVALAVAGFVIWRVTRRVEHPLMRLSVDMGLNALFSLNAGANVIISQDGRRIVFASSGADGRVRLATRALSQIDTKSVAGTEGARPDSFLSPDGEWIGFFAEGKLKKISVQGGAPVILCDAPNPRGGSWGDDNNIIFAPNIRGGLFRVSSNGGKPQALTELKGSEVTHRWPQVLPGASALLFTASGTGANYDNATLEIQFLASGERKTVHKGGTYGRYVPSGHLVYLHQGSLFARAFDHDRMEATGQPVQILDDVTNSLVTGSAQFDFSGEPSGTGTLVHLVGAGTQASIYWLDSAGSIQPLHKPPGYYTSPRFSPDGSRLVVAVFSGAGGLWVSDWQRDAMLRLTFTAGDNSPVWSPDGKHLAYDSAQTGIFWIRADGSGSPERLTKNEHLVFPYSFSPDGKRLAYSDVSPESGHDIWVLPMEGTDGDHPKAGTPQPLVRTAANERDPAFSPDGHWLAYASDESGGYEIYVRPFPGPGGKWRISNSGGRLPIWSTATRELAFQTLDNRIMMAPYTVHGESFVPGNSRLWSDKQVVSFLDGGQSIALAPGGKRFAVIMSPPVSEQRSLGEVRLLLNVFDELRRKAPGGK